MPPSCVLSFPWHWVWQPRRPEEITATHQRRGETPDHLRKITLTIDVGGHGHITSEHERQQEGYFGEVIQRHKELEVKHFTKHVVDFYHVTNMY